MRILEKSEDVLTLQNPARDFWFGNIFMLISAPFVMVISVISGGWYFVLFFVIALGWWLALALIWSSNEVNICSFNKTLGNVTIRYHGLKPRLQQIDTTFPLEDVQTVEVKKTTGYIYGTAVERYQLWLVTRRFRRIALSEEYHNGASLETIANQVREFGCAGGCAGWKRGVAKLN